MEMQQMMEFLLNELRAIRQADKKEMEANRKTDKEDFLAILDADRKKDKEDFMAKLDFYQAKTEAGHKELLSRLEDDRQAEPRERKEMMMKMMDTSHKEMVAENKPERDMETMACRETTEARLEEKEPTSVEAKPEVAQQQEVPVKDAEVMPVGEPKKKRRRDRKLTAERRRQMNERTQCQDGCQ
jgi:hypothetical protein